ncbi:MAG: galactokinase [Candidatus Helarchaeota archaeon]
MDQEIKRENFLIDSLTSFEKSNEISPPNDPEITIVRAPGRINLIGGHTDYNEGFVLPCTISMDVMVASMLNDKNFVVINSSEVGQFERFNVKNYKKTNSWIDYVKGVAHYIKKEGHRVNGFLAASNSSVPIGSGLSSSAAFEVAFCQTINSLFDLKLNKSQIAKISYLAETQYLGISCGIMDQFISALGKKDHALFLDCRPPYNNELIKITLDDEVKLVIINSNVKHSVKSFINVRKEECLKGLNILKKHLRNKKTLRDIKIDEYNKYKYKISQVKIQNRVHHVIHENSRVLEAKKALEDQDLDKLGQLMYQSHLSLDKYYDVSCPELDFIFNFLRKKEQSIGVRMTGAGKGGSLVALLRNHELGELFTELRRKYFANYNLELTIYTCSIPNGAETIKKMKI